MYLLMLQLVELPLNHCLLCTMPFFFFLITFISFILMASLELVLILESNELEKFLLYDKLTRTKKCIFSVQIFRKSNPADLF